MPVVELNPEIALKAIEGYENELEPELVSLAAFYRQFVCPRCEGEVRKELSAGGERGGHAFADKNYLTPRALLRCLDCSCLFDPHSGVVVERGKPAPIIKTL